MPFSLKTAIPIIIINWRGLEDTIECLESVLQLSYSNYKIYLVDNYSNDGSAEVFKKKYSKEPKISLILNQENLGFTKANNEVFKLILQEDKLPPYIGLLNNDTVVEPNWLTSLIATAEKEIASIISSKMIDYYDRNSMDNAGHLMLNTGEILPIGHDEHPDRFTQVFENVGACAGACLYSSKMLNDIGIFDEYFTTGYEDAELGARATLAGYKCIFDPNAIVYHKMGRSIKKVFNREYAVTIQKKVLYTYFKLIPKWNALFNIPFIMIRYIAILLIQIVSFRFSHTGIILQSIKETFIDDLPKLKLARHQFQKNRTLTSLEVAKKQTFFVGNNLKRFYHYFIQKKASAFDAYGKKELI